jgi:DNA adenine methylase
MFDRVKRAWAVWTLANMSFGSMLNGGFDCDTCGTTSGKVKSKRDAFTEQLAIRLQNVQIECSDALKIIRSRDTPDSFFYCDPPYPDTDQGHYDGYSADDFRCLLDMLSKIEGKFLLSSFRHDYLREFKDKHGWSQFEIKMQKSVTAQTGHTGTKIEVFTANYNIETGNRFQESLFR